jgi:cytochrome c-type biogenesis protein CcmH
VRRWIGWAAIGWLLLLCALVLIAYGSPTRASSLDARTRSVAQGLRCLVCQGESVADSPSGFAAGIRGVIRRQLAQGRTPDQIDAFLVSRYGDRILMAPPDQGLGKIAWLAPPLLVLGGLGLLAVMIVDWRNRGRVPLSTARQEYLERVRAELAAGER